MLLDGLVGVHHLHAGLDGHGGSGGVRVAVNGSTVGSRARNVGSHQRCSHSAGREAPRSDELGGSGGDEGEDDDLSRREVKR